MSKFKSWSYIFFTLLIMYSSVSFSQNSNGVKEPAKFLSVDALTLYKTGDYDGALKKLNQLENYQNYDGMAFYWKGLVYNKLQQFDQSAKYFRKSIQRKNIPSDLYYEYGQALYAAHNYRESYRMFRRSYKQNYKPGSSLYYMGYIKQLQNKFPEAVKRYKKVEEVKTSLDIRQAASFQVAQIYLQNAEKHPHKAKMVHKTAIPQLQKALNIDRKSSLSKDIQKQIAGLDRKYDLGYGKMKNGRPIPKKLYVLKFSQSMGYNSNVINEANTTQSAVAQKGSVITDTFFKASRRFNSKRRFHVTPEFRSSLKYHLNRHVVTVKKNDSYIFTGFLSTGIEHKLFKKPATSFLDIEYNYTARDNTGQGAKRYYSRDYSAAIGETFHLYGKHDATFKFQIKNVDTRLTSLETRNLVWSGTQLFDAFKGMISVFASYERIRYVYNTQMDNDVYTGRLDYIKAEILNKLTLTGSFTYTLFDQKHQVYERGWEQKYAPSFKIERKFMDNKLTATADYTYTRQNSKNKNSYQFKGYDMGLDLTYKF